MSKESDCEALIVCACGEGFAAERLEQKRSARIALRRNGRMSLTRPAAAGESCRAGFFFIQFNVPSFSGYIVCAEAILYFCVSDATGKRNTLRLLLRQRRGARKRRMQSVDRRDRLPDYRTFRASPFWKMRRIRFASRIRTVYTSFR